jgi:hypothetical protein
METVELAYGGSEDGSWGLGLGKQARAAFINAVGWSLVLLYCLVGHFSAIILLGVLPFV